MIPEKEIGRKDSESNPQVVWRSFPMDQIKETNVNG